MLGLEILISIISSVIAPNKYARASIKSILDSLPRNAELILHVDPSESESKTWQSGLNDSRLTVIRTESRIGFAAGLNLAAAQASFEFLGRIDMDDLCIRGRWEYQLRAIQDSDIHFGSIIHFWNKALALPHYPISLDPDEFLVLSQFCNPGFHPAALIRKSIFDDIGGYRDVLAEDYDFWLRALLNGAKIKRGMRPVTLYRHHGAQATSALEWLSLVNNDAEIVSARQSLTDYVSSLDIDSRQILRRLKDQKPFSRLEFRRIKGI